MQKEISMYQKNQEEAMYVNQNPKKSILVVDDDDNIINVFKRFFKLRNLNVSSYFANNVDKAIKILETHHIDMILTDLKMKPMDGVDLINFIKKHNNYNIDMKKNVFIMTGFPEKDRLKEICQKDVAEIIQKPFQLSKIEKLIMEK